MVVRRVEQLYSLIVTAPGVKPAALAVKRAKNRLPNNIDLKNLKMFMIGSLLGNP